MRRLQGDIFFGGLILLAAGALLWFANPASTSFTRPPPSMGKYDLKFDGGYVGTGLGRVKPRGVDIDGTVVDGNNNSMTIAARALPLDQNRFYGTGTLNDMPVQICGRVDPTDQNVKDFRICAMFLTSDNHAGRIFGTVRP